jgi:hypothetical protein
MAELMHWKPEIILKIEIKPYLKTQLKVGNVIAGEIQLIVPPKKCF